LDAQEIISCDLPEKDPVIARHPPISVLEFSGGFTEPPGSEPIMVRRLKLI
jgi:hypothetical protein